MPVRAITDPSGNTSKVKLVAGVKPGMRSAMNSILSSAGTSHDSIMRPKRVISRTPHRTRRIRRTDRSRRGRRQLAQPDRSESSWRIGCRDAGHSAPRSILRSLRAGSYLPPNVRCSIDHRLSPRPDRARADRRYRRKVRTREIPVVLVIMSRPRGSAILVRAGSAWFF